MKKDLEEAAECVRNGGVLIYPTDTVWGLGCDATNEEAVNRLLGMKGERSGSLIVLVDEAYRVSHFVKEVPEPAQDLLDVADKPTTVIYPEAVGLAAGVPAEDGSVGIRVVMHEFCKRLIERARRPLVSTSANRSGGSTPADRSELDPELLNEVDHVVDDRYESPEQNSPSAVIRIGYGGEVEILRR